MFKLFSYLKILDEKIFAMIADLKNSPSYTNLNQKIVSLDAPYQKVLQFSSFALILFLPIIVGLFMLSLIYSVNSRIGHKLEIIELADIQLSLNKNFQAFSNTIIATDSINTEDDLRSALAGNPALAGTSAKISYKDFNQSPLIGNYKDSQLTISFSEVSTPDLASVLSFFLEQYKARIVKANLNRSTQKKLLQGEIALNIISN